jgi:beta-lactamase regulating signal transducer with metallopeptidase domain
MEFMVLLFSYILIIIYDSAISLAVVLLLLFIFRIKDSSVRILFFFIPLVKPFLIIIEKIDFNKEYFKYKPGILGFRFPSPGAIFGQLKPIEKDIINFSDIDHILIYAILLSIIIILIMRWANLYIFYRHLAFEEKVNRADVPEIFAIIDSFISKIRLKKCPNVSLTYKKFYSPFIIGIKQNTLVLPPMLIDNISFSEKETLIQHELSHARRKDNLIGWIALILKDFLFFNPFAHISYLLIKTEQEKACDKLLLEFSGKSSKEIANNILNLMLKIKSLKKSNKIHRDYTGKGYNFIPVQMLNNRIIYNRIGLLVSTKIEKIHMKKITKILMFLIFLILFLSQVVIVIRINSFFIFLR